MKVLTEYELRAMCLSSDTTTFKVEEGTFVMPGAKEYLRDRGIELVFVKPKPGLNSFVPEKGDFAFYDAETGKGFHQKPENMTHLLGNLLVNKNHKRIIFRGKLDSLEAKIIELQLLASEENCFGVVDDLDDIYRFVRMLMSSEVNKTSAAEVKLLGMSSSMLRYNSHHVFKEYGINHAYPVYTAGKLCVGLNMLRTVVRETELAAVEAFCESSECTRLDIIESLNRLSSCVYIVYCRKLSGYYEKRSGNS